MNENFDTLVTEALNHDFSGWDFSWLNDRWYEENPPWNYPLLVQEQANQVKSLLDLGTGGGEFLASLKNLPVNTYASENYPPNFPIAQAQLEPLGVNVFSFTDDKTIPLPGEMFDLVINRHESYWMPEIWRLLKPGGIFLSQQVGGLDCMQLNEFLGAPYEPDYKAFSRASEVTRVEEAGFHIIRSEERFLDSLFYDIGAVTFFLKVITWQIPNFTVDKYREPLQTMHQHILENGYFAAKAHRFLIEAEKV